MCDPQFLSVHKRKRAKNVEHVCLRKARSHSRSHELGTS
ncbi:unnamed protein product [Brassica oleracea]